MMDFADGATPTRVARPTRRRIRAIRTTIIVLLASYLVKYLCDLILGSLPIFNNESISSGFGIGAIYFIVDVLWPVAPAAMGGMYWLALRGLQRRSLRVILFDVTSFGVIFFLGTSLLFNIVAVAAIRIFYGDEYLQPGQITFFLRALIQYPIVWLFVLLISGIFAIVIVKLAQFFALWPSTPASSAGAVKQRWVDFGTIWGVTTIIAIACQIIFILMGRYIQTPFVSQGISFDANGLLLRFIDFFIPSGIVATIACADTLRTLRNSPIADITPAPLDPFASSDGSFNLSISPITEDK